MSTKTLSELYNEYKVGDWPDKGSTHSYIEVYEQILASYRNKAKNVLEIGLMSGESLRMWTEYFNGDVYGMDCHIKPIDGKADLTKAIADGLKIVIGDATKKVDIERAFEGIKFDVIIEDANHQIQQQVEIFNQFKPYMNGGGLYIIEDVENIDETREIFEKIAPYHVVKILDRRNVKNRFDDVLILIYF